MEMDGLLVAMMLLAGMAFLLHGVGSLPDPAGDFRNSVRDIVGEHAEILHKLNLPAEMAPDAEKEQFLADLRLAVEEAKLQALGADVLAICRQAGVLHPTNSDRLHALQILERRRAS